MSLSPKFWSPFFVVFFSLCFGYGQQNEEVDIDKLIATRPIKLALIDKGRWYMFRDSDQTNELCELSVDDSLHLMGWAPWMFVVKRNNLIGYVTYAAFEPTPELKKIIDIIDKKSEEIENEKKPKADKLFEEWQTIKARLNELDFNLVKNIRRSDSLNIVNQGNLFLRLSASKNEIYEGECTILNLAFYVSNRNTLRLRFHEEYQPNPVDFPKTNAWVSSGSSISFGVTDFQTEVFGEKVYSKYTIFKQAYCPSKHGQVLIKPATVIFDKIKIGSDSVEDVLPFKSKGLAINVKPLPLSEISKTDFYKPSGVYLVEESMKPTIKKFEIARYQLKVLSTSVVFPIDAPKWSHADLIVNLQSEIDSDTIIDHQYYSSKTWQYSVSSSKSGSYNLSKKIFTYFNPYTRKIESLHAGPKLSVNAEKNLLTSINAATLFKKDAIIAIDVSQSMLIEDYSPNRLAFIKNDLLDFLGGKKNCNIGLIAFAGDARQIKPFTRDSCYIKNSILPIDYRMFQKGTAIGDAIWLGIKSFKNSNKHRVMIIVGDGDNTAGHLYPDLATEIATRMHVKIYSIGVGHSGVVSYGKDYYGKTMMVDNTFSDSELKKISSATGGRYYWAEKPGDIKKILKEIFLENSF